MRKMTERERRQIDLLDAYWAAWARDPMSAPPEDLDRGLAEVVWCLARDLPAPEPEAAFSDTLRRVLEAEARTLHAQQNGAAAPERDAVPRHDAAALALPVSIMRRENTMAARGQRAAGDRRVGRLIMTTGLTDDLIAAERELDAARAELLEVLDALADDALDRARRGGWSVQRVLQHVIEAEWHYARIATQLRRLPPAAAESRTPPASVPEAVRRLAASRQALLAAVEGVDAASFYQVGIVGNEEYSVLSLLENAANHDREHARQIRSIATPT